MLPRSSPTNSCTTPATGEILGGHWGVYKKTNLRKEARSCQRPVPIPARVVHLLQWIWMRPWTSCSRCWSYQGVTTKCRHGSGCVTCAGHAASCDNARNSYKGCDWDTPAGSTPGSTDRLDSCSMQLDSSSELSGDPRSMT